MELRLISGNFSDAATTAVIDALGANNTFGSAHIFIAPDSQTLSIEREIFERLNLEGAVNIDVTGFSRLAKKVLGNNLSPALSKEGAVLLLKKVINENRAFLKHYRRAADTPGFAAELFAVISSVRASGYEPADFAELSEGTPGTSGAKARDISLLYEKYVEKLNSGYEDAYTKLDKLAAAAGASQYIRDSHVYISGFPTFTAKQYLVIKSLLLASKSLTVGITPGTGSANSDVFPEETRDRLIFIAEEVGVKVVETEVNRILPEPYGIIHRNLFSASKDNYNGNYGKFIIYRERNVFDEINAVALEIMRLHRREGVEFKNIAVVAPEKESKEIIKSVFTRVGIPFFIDTRYRLAETLAGSALLSTLIARSFNLRADKAIALAYEPLIGLSRDEREAFENYTLKYNVNYNRFSETFKYDEEAERGRLKVLKAAAFFKLSGTTAEYCDAALAFSDYYSLCDIGDEYLSGAGASIAEVNKKAGARIKELIEETAKLSGECRETADTFHGAIAAVFEAEEMAIIPESINSVFVGGVKESRYDALNVLFITGAVRDAFPLPHRYNAIISPLDEAKFLLSGIRLFPTPPDLIKEEEFYILELFTKADKIYIGYADISAGGAKSTPSPVINELTYLTGKNVVSLYDKFSFSNSKTSAEIEDATVSIDNALFRYLNLARQDAIPDLREKKTAALIYEALPDIYKERADFVAKDKKDVFVPPDKFYFSWFNGAPYTKITEIESFYTCPYRHHLAYGIKLCEREIAGVKIVDVGNIIHRALELYFGNTVGKLDGLTAREQRKEAENAVETACAEWKSKVGYIGAISENVLANVTREALYAIKKLTENTLKGKYRPVYTELSFGSDGIRSPVRISGDGTDIFLRGKIDRVDMYGDSIIILDYKTGSADGDVSELYYGTKLQLFIYLGVLTADGYRPGGAFYVPIKDSYSANAELYKLTGTVLFEDNVLDALDSGLLDAAAKSGKKVFKSKIAPITAAIGKNGVYYKKGLNSATASEFDYYMEYAALMVRNAVKDILSGVIEKSPYKGKCVRCPYAAVCLGEGEENYREVKKTRPCNTDRQEDSDG